MVAAMVQGISAAAFLLLSLAMNWHAIAAPPPPLSLDDLYSSPSLFGTPPSPPVWSPDSSHFAFLWNNEGRPEPQLWVATKDGSKLRQLSVAATGAFIWRLDGSAIVSLRGNELWNTQVSDGRETRLGALGAGVSSLSLAPDGKTAAYLKGGDLWLVDLASGQSRALTDIGIGPLSTLRSPYETGLPQGRYSRPEREIGPGIWGGPSYKWSPDGKTIAAHYVDRRGLRKVPFPNYLAPETDSNEVRRGYPGDDNEARQIGLLRVADGRLRLLETSDPSANQIIDFSWSSEGMLLLDMASDTAVDRWLYTVDPRTAVLNEIWHSERATRIYTSFASRWHPNSKEVIFLSDLDDRYGLFKIDAFADEQQPKRLSDPRADVLGAPQITASGDLFYPASTAGGRERQIFRISANTNKSAKTRDRRQITELPGMSSGYPSPDGQNLAFIHSSDTAPPEIYVTSTGKPMPRRITHSPLPQFSKREWVKGHYVSFDSLIDDYTLHARILQPATLTPGKKYPVLFGPMYSNTVRNRWRGIYSSIQQLLVQKGYIVVQVDVRGSTGYGRAFREAFLNDFAGDDIEDIVSAVAYLKTLPYVDDTRMGIWGSSYGGTLSVYSLLKKPGLFRAGVAAAAAVDPYFFGTDDVAIVRRPDTHPDVFLHQAARYAANLEDHLLIIHGMQDQVVPFKTTAALADILIRNGKNFDFAFAPGATHAWSREDHYSKFLFAKMLAHFDRYLTPDEPAFDASKNGTNP